MSKLWGLRAAAWCEVTITCKGNMTSLSIDPSLINVAERDMLEDMIKAACNDARTKADQKMAEETQKIMADMGLPAGFKLPF
jgi:DNA-binding protein YbaB